jgi:hypothetical protein
VPLDPFVPEDVLMPLVPFVVLVPLDPAEPFAPLLPLLPLVPVPDVPLVLISPLTPMIYPHASNEKVIVAVLSLFKTIVSGINWLKFSSYV